MEARAVNIELTKERTIELTRMYDDLPNDYEIANCCQEIIL